MDRARGLEIFRYLRFLVLPSKDEMSTATRTPLPKLQLAILMVMLGAEPICNSVIFPFVNQFVRETGVTNGDERKTGYYAGIVESIFFVAECLTVLWWGRASDRIGRRPILLFGMLGLSFSMLSFGLSSKYLMIVVSRCAQGVFNGNVGVGKNSIMEITDKTNVADAFAVYPVVWATGSTLGPIIGGSLARPAVRWPDTFGKILFFQKYPYFLPCAIPGLYAIMVYIFGSIFLNETLPAKIARRRANDTVESAGLLESDFHHTSYGTDAGSETAARGEEIEFKSPPVSSILSSRPILISLTTHAFLSFVDQSHQVLLPLMYSTSIPLGGLGFQPARIGAIMGVWGICNGIFQWLFFAKLIRKFGPRTMFRVSFSCYLVCIGAYPAMSYLTKQAGGIVDSKVYAVMLVQFMCYSLSFMVYGCNQLFILDALPSPAALATTNGLAQIVSSVMRSLGPGFTASMFSLSLERQLAGGYMVYWILWVVIILGIHASSKLPMHVKG
ncbi:MFS transporter superfamily protein [Pleurotus pulmonarius]